MKYGIQESRNFSFSACLVLDKGSVMQGCVPIGPAFFFCSCIILSFFLTEI